MSDELEINPALVGRRVAVPNRPEWGTGKVLRVQSTTANGQAVHRVSVQFDTGHRTLVVPPARLTEPQAEPTREAGWLEQIGKVTPDDRLVSLPPSVAQRTGPPAQRLAALAPLYAYTDEPASLIEWARRQAGVADPLSLWSRDELAVAFRAFREERDGALRVAGALLKQKEGPEGLEAALEAFEKDVAAAMWAALRRAI